MVAATNLSVEPAEERKIDKAQEIVRQHAANEIVFAVVGYVGSGTTEVAKTLEGILNDSSLAGEKFQVRILKASRVIADWAQRHGHSLPTGKKRLRDVERYQDLGDMMRANDHAAVARGLIGEIRKARADLQGEPVVDNAPVVPNGKPRAYILDSIRHPAEANLLRHVYQDAFILVGVGCERDVREKRLHDHYSDAGAGHAKEFMERDAKASEKHGQRTSEAFHLADFFVDNSESRTVKDEASGAETDNEKWDVPDKLSRLIEIVCHEKIWRPTIEETAMYHAYGAQMRSACLSRQVGAAVIDRQGNLLATGTNEVPKAGGGVYGEDAEPLDAEERKKKPYDKRCYFSGTPYCRNSREQNEIISDVLDDIGHIVTVTPMGRESLRAALLSGRIGDLLEFSRAVHAEMDAILSAARAGASVVGARLFVTTFPCHYCARHIISAGIDEVQYIEPYPKSPFENRING